MCVCMSKIDTNGRWQMNEYGAAQLFFVLYGGDWAYVECVSRRISLLIHVTCFQRKARLKKIVAEITVPYTRQLSCGYEFGEQGMSKNHDNHRE